MISRLDLKLDFALRMPMALDPKSRQGHPFKQRQSCWKKKLIGKRSSLSKRMLFYILLCSTSFALVITFIQLAWDYQEDVSLVEKNLAQIEASYLFPIAASLWALDKDQVKHQIEGILKLPDIQYVRVNELIDDEEVTMLESGQFEEAFDLRQEFNLTYEGQIIGRLLVAVSLSEVYRRILQKAIIILSSQGVKTLLVSMAILFIIYLLVIRHLKTIAEYTRQLDLDNLDEPLKLDRPERNNDDELSEMVTTFNYMREKVKNEYSAKMNATEQLIKEQAFSTTIINSSNAVITCLDDNLSIISTNPAGTALCGIEQNELMGKNWLDVYCDFSSRQEIKLLLKNLITLKNKETHFTASNNKVITLLWSFIPFNQKNSPYKLIAFGHDITEIKKFELEMKSLNSQLENKVIERTESLENSNQQLKLAFINLKATQTSLLEAKKMASLGGLVAGVAHEINTPVGISVTAASFLHNRASEIIEKVEHGELNKSELKSFLADVNQSTDLILDNQQRAAELISSFKKVSVDPSSHINHRFGLTDNIKNVITSLNYDIDLAQCQVNVDCDEKLLIDSYPGSFQQIFSNLILNSISHGFDNWNKERIINIQIEVNDNTLNIVYSDTGRGVDQKIAERIFDPFVTSKRGQGGSGLGTHIVFNLVVQLLRGRIEFESQPNQGVLFRIHLPFDQDESGLMIIPSQLHIS